MIHEPGCDCDAYACKLRAKGVTVSAGRARSTPRKGTPGNNAQYNSWERGIAGERRPGGGFMPLLKPNAEGQLDRVTVKDHATHRHQHNEVRRRQHDQAVSAGHHH